MAVNSPGSNIPQPYGGQEGDDHKRASLSLPQVERGPEGRQVAPQHAAWPPASRVRAGPDRGLLALQGCGRLQEAARGPGGPAQGKRQRPGIQGKDQEVGGPECDIVGDWHYNQIQSLSYSTIVDPVKKKQFAREAGLCMKYRQTDKQTGVLQGTFTLLPWYFSGTFPVLSGTFLVIYW